MPRLRVFDVFGVVDGGRSKSRGGIAIEERSYAAPPRFRNSRAPAMPSLLMRLRNVLGGRPSLSAAPPVP
jgi:hypothetical protein